MTSEKEGKELLHFDETNFESEVLKSEKPVLVDFTATWCGPCQKLKPTLKKLFSEKHDIVRVGQVDIDENSELAQKYGVRSVPTVVLMYKGKEAERIIGAAREDKYLDAVNKLLVSS